MDAASYSQINRLLKAIRRKAADALWHEHQNDATAAAAIQQGAKVDYDELKLVWEEKAGSTIPSRLGQHISFWHQQDHFDILRIDIPEIDAALEKLLRSPREKSTPTDLIQLLHPKMVEHGYPHLKSGHLREAVLNSIIAVFDMIRARSGRNDDGESLITHVFSPTKPVLIFSEMGSTSGHNDQLGFMQILQGVWKGVRNTKAHTLGHDLTPTSAAQYLVFASLLARRVEAATLAETKLGPGDVARPKTGTRHSGSQPAVQDLFVYLDYVEAAGIAPRLREEGYQLQWVRADQEAKKVNLEGWEVVVEDGKDGTPTRFKVKDPIREYLIFIKKK